MKTLKLLIFLLAAFFFIHSTQSQPPKPGNAFRVCIGGRMDGKIPPAFFAENNTIVPYNLKSNYAVVAYRLTIVRKGRKQEEFECKDSNRLTPEMSNALTDLPKGSKVYIEFIRLKNKNGRTITARPLFFTIN